MLRAIAAAAVCATADVIIIFKRSLNGASRFLSRVASEDIDKATATWALRRWSEHFKSSF